MNRNDTNDALDARASAATDQLVASFADLDTEAALHAALCRVPTKIHERTRPGQTRWIAIAAAAALVVGGIVAVAATRSRTAPPALTPATQPTTVASAVPVAPTFPIDTAVPATSTSQSMTTDPAPPATPASVSYLNPPPVLPMRSLGTIPVPATDAGYFAVAVGEEGVAVGQWQNDQVEVSQIDVVDFNGQIRTVPNIKAGALLAYGPGDIAYLTRQGASIQDFVVVAVPLSGDNAGTAVATEPANVNLFIHYGPLSFGHSTDAVIHRRDHLAETVVVPYVDANGQPMTLDAEPPTYKFASTDGASAGLRGVITSSTGASWTLTAEAAPGRAETYLGNAPPAPGPDGEGIYVTHIGPNGDSTLDFGEPTMWVMARLDPSGSATWWSLSDGWQVVASDTWGTVLAKQTGTDLELALVDFDA